MTDSGTLKAEAFKARMTDSVVVSEAVTIIQVPLVITPITFPVGQRHQGYPAGMMLQAVGGIPNYKWSWTADKGSKLPPGLTLTASGTITGMPTRAGKYNFIVKLTDAKKQIATLPLSLVVN